MNRITALLAQNNRRKLLVPFFTVGYPDYRTSLQLVQVGLDAGADFVELGMPFSDPMADGPDIQFASQTALDQGTNMHQVFDAVTAIRKSSQQPILLMGYYNPVYAYGDDTFAAKARQVGVDGLIIPDLPADEAGALRIAARNNNLSMVFLVSPTSSPERIKLIDKSCTDFVYAVAITGVTGGRTGFDRSTTTYLKGLRKQLSKPFVAGFGVSTPETAVELGRYTDGVVIGSALIQVYRTARNRKAGLQKVARLLTSLRKALK